MARRMDEYIIPSNYNDGKHIKGIAYRNLLEGVIFSFIAFKIIELIPFVKTFKIFLLITVCGGLIIFFAIGIKGESVLSYLLAYALFKKRRRKLHMKPVGIRVKNEGTEKDEKNEKGI